MPSSPVQFLKWERKVQRGRKRDRYGKERNNNCLLPLVVVERRLGSSLVLISCFIYPLGQTDTVQVAEMFWTMTVKKGSMQKHE